MKKLLLFGIVSILCCTSFARSIIPHKVEIHRDKDKYGNVEIYATIDTVRQGLCIDYDSLGRRKAEFCFVNGKITGPFIVFYITGDTLQTSYLINGVTDGPSITYYPNGKIKSFYNVKMGKKDGHVEFYTEDGQLDKQFLFQNDTLIRVLYDGHKLPFPLGWEPLEKD